MKTTHVLQIYRLTEEIDARGMPTQTRQLLLKTRCDLQQGHYELDRSEEGDKRRMATYAAYVPAGTSLQAIQVGDAAEATGPFDVKGRVAEVDFFSYVVYIR